MGDQQQEKGETFICSNCGRPLTAGDRYCSACGVYIVAEGVEIPCKRCGKPVKGNFCPNCGSPLEVTENEQKTLEGRGGKPAGFLRRSVKAAIEGVEKVLFSVIDGIFGIE